MKTLVIKNLPIAEELDSETMAAVRGGRIKLSSQSTSTLLTSPDGEPVSVYVDGVLVNSVSDGFVHL